ncbi:MAG TPA: AbgT family transporter [Geminicoccaceae bacterium]|nr:AbgT family transporter [Geminicoccaceae bacterium]
MADTTGAITSTHGRKTFLDRFLDGVERVGNKVPHPAVIFLVLIAIVILLSHLLYLLDISVTYPVVDYLTDEVVERTTAVRSLLTADGLRFMLTSPVPNFMSFGPVAVILVAMIGVGLAEESGLIKALVRQIVVVAPRSAITFIIVLLGVVSSIAADAGYLVLVPLGAAAFHSLGRHPLAGLAAAFAGVAGGFLTNLFVTPTDAILTEITNDAIRLLNPTLSTGLTGNLFFMIASTLLVAIVCTVLTERFIEPHLGPYQGGVPIDTGEGVTDAERRGLRFTLWTLAGFVVVIGLLSAPPGAVLRHQETGAILGGSPFMDGLIVLIMLLFLALGIAYGKGAGTINTVTEGVNAVVKTFNSLAGLVFLLLVIAQFIAFFNFTNIATVTAVGLADLLGDVQIGTVGLLVGFVVVIGIVDLLITGAIAKWAIFAPVFVPLFMQLGVEPDFVLAAYRVGDSPANVITPLNVYLAMIVAFAQKYQPESGVGTVVALMLPYTVVLFIVWTLMLVGWYLLGIPLGFG